MSRGTNTSAARIMSGNSGAYWRSTAPTHDIRFAFALSHEPAAKFFGT
jgi:hypothetical protein